MCHAQKLLASATKHGTGMSDIIGIEVMIENEQDSHWPIRQERILEVDELAHDKLSGLPGSKSLTQATCTGIVLLISLI